MNKTKDAKSKSLSEAFVNSFGGYPIGYGVSLVVLPLSVDWIKEDPFVASLFIGLVFASVSFTRVYYLRRLFERLGINDNFIQLGIKLCKKIQSQFRTNKLPGILRTDV